MKITDANEFERALTGLQETVRQITMLENKRQEILAGLYDFWNRKNSRNPEVPNAKGDGGSHA